MLATADSERRECSRKRERKSSACSELGVAIFVEVSSSPCIKWRVVGEGVFVGESPGGKARSDKRIEGRNVD